MISILSKFVARRRLRGSCLSINSVLSIALMLIIVVASNKAQGNRHQTNKNDISNLFKQEIEDRQGLDQFLENSKKQAESGIGNKAGLGELGANESALENKTSELNSINANSLESRGQIERAKEENSYYDSLEIDYTDPKILNHKRDVDKIADANKRLMSRLIEGLRDLDIDCKTVKGDRELEPQYVIEIEKEHFKDVTYNQHICEELRNRYNCNDTVTLTCKVKGIQWGEWQDKQIEVDGGELIKFSAHRDMFDGHHVASKCFEYKLFSPDSKKLKGFGGRDYNPGTIPNMREFLALKHNATIDNIGTTMSFSWHGGIFSISGWMYAGRVLGSKDYAWAKYVINYKYRDGNPACFEWQEDWNEVCKLQ
ncbi:hypothetical protein Trichorick_01862 (plasmid) [Candidatus Trichorickettsia mobilis]|uniref:hypothetical protein n=1 Tax=Candidatus Trichorickettsia mobilis TaxID=1346319 RepID=UPI002B25ABAE|nr:hypothetical protein [Candidatus Trichorickettsia mobilis]WPY01938.1 hypothetical protein Trichorick_01862 [Candidatus Trichorickettsia mobilis]